MKLVDVVDASCRVELTASRLHDNRFMSLYLMKYVLYIGLSSHWMCTSDSIVFIVTPNTLIVVSITVSFVETSTEATTPLSPRTVIFFSCIKYVCPGANDFTTIDFCLILKIFRFSV
uniref:Uncharacterized protein n=1 Tax=Cacopsylla melanoneura TaxID=428564 RepID=A0A8D8SZL4_9HEMI